MRTPRRRRFDAPRRTSSNCATQRLRFLVITSTFKAEKTLTKDTVPVDVAAVLFWKVIDPKKAALDVADYSSDINWAAQTAPRVDVVGASQLPVRPPGERRRSPREL